MMSVLTMTAAKELLVQQDREQDAEDVATITAIAVIVTERHSALRKFGSVNTSL